MNPGGIIIQLVIGGFIWFFILGYFLRDQHIEFLKVVLWYGAALAAGAALMLLGELGVIDAPMNLLLIAAVFLKTAVIALCLRLEYSAWPFRRLVPALAAFFVINTVHAAWLMLRTA